jgi:uncharacterized protein YjdB
MRRFKAAAARIGLSLALAVSSFSAVGVGSAVASESGGQEHRRMEQLDRAPVAVQTGEGVYVGWRMLGTDEPSIAFNLYRDGVKVNAAPLVNSTNYLDETGQADSVYEIRPVLNGAELAARSETTSVWNAQYRDIPISKPADGVTPDGGTYTYRANDASVGDLDGDGQYEIILKWDPSNAKDNSQSGYTGNVYLDAYRMDGTFLWRVDMGRNIRAGAHYTQFMVYDFDGDGRAEVAAKTADATVDGGGNVIGDADADYRNASGRVLSGPEFLTVFDGLTGRAMVTVDYDPPRGNIADWGDTTGNRVDRFLAGVAYLDGRTPSLIMARGYYTRTVIVAYRFANGKLEKQWTFDSKNEGYNAWGGQGYHSLSIADVDQDEKDEIIYGQITIDDDGTGLYNSGLGHGDALHVGDLIPGREGLEIFSVQESTGAQYGYDMRDAKTGEILWGYHTGQDTGRGLTADIDPRYEGNESWAIRGEWNSRVGGIHQANGERISENIPTSNFAIWWDGDPLRELLDHDWNEGTATGVGKIDKWDYENNQLVGLLRADGTLSNNHTKGTPVLQADLLGDWREEVIWRLADSSALRLFTTTEVTQQRIYTLMHDPQYRLAIAWQNVAYNQPPHPSFFIGSGMEEPPAPRIVTKQGTGSISGWVDNGDGKPVRAAVVSVTVGGKAYSALTNGHGYYSIQPAPAADNVILSATKAGCTAGTAVVDIKSGVSQDVSVGCPITSVMLDRADATVLFRETLQLNAAVLPEDASLRRLEWTSSHPEVATVDRNGLLTAHALGQTTIKASALNDPAINASMVITVAGVAVEELLIDKSVLNLQVGTAKTIGSLVLPANAYNKTVRWESSAPQVAAVDDQGQVTGIATGSATITATTEDGGLSELVAVSVQAGAVAASGVALDLETYYFRSDYFSELNPAAKPPLKRLTAQVLPAAATNNDIVWSSSDAAIAAVDAFGRVTAVSAGTAVITATTVDGSFKAETVVHVPKYSESFDNRNIGDSWKFATGTMGGSGNLGGSVADVAGNRVFRMSGGGTGPRSTQKVFTEPVTADKVWLEFDWQTGAPAGTPGAQFSIEDSNGNRYVTLQLAPGREMEYGTGGKAANQAIAGTPVASGFHVNDALYHVQAVLHFAKQTVDLKLTNKDNQRTEQLTDIPFDPNTAYTNNVAKIQFALARASATSSWTTWIDNFNVYGFAAEDEEEEPEIPDGEHWAQAAISGPESAYPGQAVELNVGVTQVAQGFTTLDVIVQYDPAKLEFATASGENGATMLADNAIVAKREHLHILATAVRPSEGQVRIIAMSAGEEHAVTAGGELFALRGKVKAGATGGNASTLLEKFEVSLGGTAGIVNIAPAHHSLSIGQTPPVESDKTALLQAIALAQAQLAKAVEGEKIGKYPAGSKATLQAAIDAASSVRSNVWASQAEVDAATGVLNAAVQQFHAKFISLVDGQTQITLRDLSMIAKYFGATSADPNWSEIAKADLFEEGEINIRVLAAVAQMILADWSSKE